MSSRNCSQNHDSGSIIARSQNIFSKFFSGSWICVYFYQILKISSPNFSQNHKSVCIFVRSQNTFWKFFSRSHIWVVLSDFFNIFSEFFSKSRMCVYFCRSHKYLPVILLRITNLCASMHFCQMSWISSRIFFSGSRICVPFCKILSMSSRNFSRDHESVCILPDLKTSSRNFFKITNLCVFLQILSIPFYSVW